MKAHTNSVAFTKITLRLAETARPFAKSHFRTSSNVEGKADSSPVTETEQTAEKSVKTISYVTCPKHSIL
ncbi:hypothetical protein [Falsihalocynthiibacter arcticus]|uniref:Uncharacterized protein n=1 Tax=Falsihalocynthiibacter arcticus TaxID=1579316 RepID=A0A126V456_9RHOB|nr:hypothetical protein [Falsihalocynthiibacter arcticus]AML53098.1 hypothetical protein RC74_19200 [Falsihalocynthiibacter arcticus]